MPTVIDGQLGVSKIQDNTVTSPKIVSNSVNYDDLVAEITARLGSAGSISGDRNRVINGSCQIVNVASLAVPNNSGVVYGGPELFAVANSGAGGQFTQSQGSLTWEGITLPTVRQTVNTANTSIAEANLWTGIGQALEGFNVFDLRGKPIALSFVFNTNLSGTYSVSVRDNGLSRSYVSSFVAVANTPVKVTILVAAIPLAANIPNSNEAGLYVGVGLLNTGTYQTATLNQWQSGNFASATGATNWGATAGNFIELTNLQLEEGTVATPFIRRSYQQELALTQRYYEQSQQGTPYFRWFGTTNVAFGGFFAVEKRNTPTISGTYDLNDGASQPLTNAVNTVLNTKAFSYEVTGSGFVDLNSWTASARL